MLDSAVLLRSVALGLLLGLEPFLTTLWTSVPALEVSLPLVPLAVAATTQDTPLVSPVSLVPLAAAATTQATTPATLPEPVLALTMVLQSVLLLVLVALSCTKHSETSIHGHLTGN
uniref:Uncharacterized protein n=1 Tax=Anopheles atroparvus TaxID=41427 RepID=A0A182JNA3_ANOAO